MLQVGCVGCVSISYIETLLAFIGLLAALRELLEDYQEATQRKRLLQVQKCVCM